MRPNPALIRASQHIKFNWRSGESLKEIAARFHLDPGNLDRHFLNSEGRSFKRFQRDMRRAYIMERLQRDSVAAYQLAEELGFSSPAAFSRWVSAAFKKPFRALKLETGNRT